jgi:FKBP-type peptidyl-prolyl cis-trans isomerase
MSMYELNRRNMLRFATAAFGSASMPTNGYADADDDISWTLHNGPFNMDNLKDYTKTDSGLLYKDIAPGSGSFPNRGDAVRIQMTGYIFESGEKWANTYKGIPTYHSVLGDGVIPNQKFMKGLNECTQTMRRGGRRILVIPAYLACNYTEMLSEKNLGVAIIPHGSSLVCYVEV